MKKLLPVLLLLTHCADVEPLPLGDCDASRIEGRWQDSDWNYEFQSPHLRQWIDIGGTVPVEQKYLYATRGDTLWSSGPGGTRMWLVCFPDDSTCEYRRWDVWKWSPVMRLRRM